MITPYFDDGQVQLFHGRLEDVLPQLDRRFDLVIADPPYGETSLELDRWPEGWSSAVAPYAASMWVFGSMRMFLDQRNEFPGWRMSQDVVWRKNAPSFNPGDRFSRIHEHALHWYQGGWADIYHIPERVSGRPRRAGEVVRRSALTPDIQGARGASTYTFDGLAYRTTVIDAANVRGGINATQKPGGIVRPLIEYGCPPGGTVLSPFAGSGTDLLEARALGRWAVGIEAREEQCETTAARLAQGTLDFS